MVVNGSEFSNQPKPLIKVASQKKLLAVKKSLKHTGMPEGTLQYDDVRLQGIRLAVPSLVG